MANNQHTRTLTLDFSRANADDRSVPAVLSTEFPVDRGGYAEVLSHSPSAIDLSRAPLPLIESHDLQKVNIGIVDSLRIEGGKLRGMARFGNSARAQELFADAQAGFVRSLSIGYRWLASKPGTDKQTTLVTRWQPYEVSVVAVPADPNAGFNRTMNTRNEDEATPLTRSQRKAQHQQDRASEQAMAEERARSAELLAMGRAHSNTPGVSELCDKAVAEGWTIDEGRDGVLEMIQRHSQRSRDTRQGGNFGHSFTPLTDADGMPLGMNQREADRYSLVRALRACTDNKRRDAGFEFEVSKTLSRQLGRETEGIFLPVEMLVNRSAYSTAASGTGGALVATNLLAGSFIDVLRNQARVLQAGATILPGLVGNVSIPRQSTASAVTWVSGDGQALTESEATFDNITLSPKTVGTLSSITRNMLMQSTPAIEAIVRADMMRVVGLGIDAASLYGSGSGSIPLGIAGQSGIGSVVGGTNGLALTFDHLISLYSTVASQNGIINPATTAFMLNPASVAALMRLKATTGQYLWNGGLNSAMSSGEPQAGTFTYGGFQVLPTNQCRANLTKGTGTNLSEVFFGDFSQVLIGQWGVLEIVPNPYDPTAYAAGSILLRVMQSLDIGVRHPQSFARMADAITT